MKNRKVWFRLLALASVFVLVMPGLVVPRPFEYEDLSVGDPRQTEALAEYFFNLNNEFRTQQFSLESIAGDALPEFSTNWQNYMIVLGQDMIKAVPFDGFQEALNQFGDQILHAAPNHGFGAVGALFAGYELATSELTCTATLVANDTILTAAHCYYAEHPQIDYWYYNQYVGIVKIAEEDDVDSFVTFRGDPENPDTDLALGTLSSTIVGVKPLVIADTEPDSGTTAFILGFGITHHEGADRGVKRRGRVLTADCGDPPGDTWACFTPPDATVVQSHCQSDSGGPMLYLPEESEEFEVLGVASNSHWLCNGTGLYASTTHADAQTWLTTQMAALDSDIGLERNVLKVEDTDIPVDADGNPLVGTVIGFTLDETTGMQANFNHAQTSSNPADIQMNTFALELAPVFADCTQKINHYVITCKEPTGTLPLGYTASAETGYGNMQLIISRDHVVVAELPDTVDEVDPPGPGEPIPIEQPLEPFDPAPDPIEPVPPRGGL